MSLGAQNELTLGATSVSLGSVRAVLFWVACLTACGGAPESHVPPGSGGANAPTAACLPAPVNVASPVFVATKSRLALGVEVSEQQWRKLVDEALPHTVAHDTNVKAGVAGRASYTIERRHVALLASSDGVKLATPLEGKIEVCKPLGSVCFGYGRCTPEWEAEVRLPQRITSAQAPHVDFELKLRKGCVLSPVRFDATAELKKVTQQQERRIEEQINRAVAKQFKSLLEALREGWNSERLPSGECVSFQPEQAHVGLRTSNAEGQTTHTLVGAVTGVATSECTPTRLEPAFAVTLEPSVVNETALTIEQPVALATVEQAWAKADPRFTTTVRASGAYVFVQASPFGRCGAAWGRFAPELTSRGVVLRPIEVSDPELASWVAARGPLLAPYVARQNALLNDLHQHSTTTTEAKSSSFRGWALAITPKLRATRSVRVVNEGLVLATELRGAIEADLRRSKD